jgi:rod shape-determining protein MreD
VSPQPTVRRSRRQRRRRRVRLPDHSVIGAVPWLRLGLLGLLVGLLQLVLFSRVWIVGMQIDLAVLTLLMVGLLAGPISGAAFGFGLGLLLDGVSGQTLGLSSLSFVLTGYAVGRLGQLRDPESSAVPVVVGVFGTFAALVLYGLLELMLNQSTRVSPGMIWVIVGTTLINALLALPVHNRVKRWLLPMLPEEARRRRRRRAYGSRSTSDLDVRIR